MTAALLRDGLLVFAPVVHSHPLVAYGLPVEWAFWQRYDREHLERCEDLMVLMLPGWEESLGLRAEIALAEALGLPIHYLDPESVQRLPTKAPDTSDESDVGTAPTNATRPPIGSLEADARAG